MEQGHRCASRPSRGDPGKIVLRGGFHARYVPTGHLLYVHAGTLYGVRFDLDRLGDHVGQPVPVIESVVATPGPVARSSHSPSNGTLAMCRGHPPAWMTECYWILPDGKTSALKAAPGDWGNPRFSPDGKRIALQVAYGSHDQLAIYDWATDRLTQLTFDAANHRFPIWTPDGQRIVYSSDDGQPGMHNMFWQPANGSGRAASPDHRRGQPI